MINDESIEAFVLDAAKIAEPATALKALKEGCDALIAEYGKNMIRAAASSGGGSIKEDEFAQFGSVLKLRRALEKNIATRSWEGLAKK